MAEMPFDDPLIDLKPKDLLDMIRVYSVYAKQEKSLFVPQLFQEESPLQTNEPLELLDLKSQETLNELSLNRRDLSRLLLTSLTDIIKKKEPNLSLANTSDRMYHYA